MNNLVRVFKNKNIVTGYLYFYIHLITEIVCFYLLGTLFGDKSFLWLAPFIYDCFAFVPQSLVGMITDKYPKLNISLIGIVILLIGFLCFFLNLLPGRFTAILILCMGNAFIHVAGAEITLRTANGKMASSAIFVAGGSFGVVIGKLLSKTVPYYVIAILGLSMIPFSLLAETYKSEFKNNVCDSFNYHNEKVPLKLIILLAVFVVIVRGYMGYGIPTSWNKTVTQTIMLYSFMGIGKALGGILIDSIGMRKTAVLSAAGAIPFLLFGDKIMFISLFGIMLFSMTMAICLGLLVSVLKQKPGIAFGLTTIGLFLGTIPIFFIKINSLFINCLMILILSIICLIILLYIIRKDNKNEIN